MSKLRISPPADRIVLGLVTRLAGVAQELNGESNVCFLLSNRAGRTAPPPQGARESLAYFADGTSSVRTR